MSAIYIHTYMYHMLVAMYKNKTCVHTNTGMRGIIVANTADTSRYGYVGGLGSWLITHTYIPTYIHTAHVCACNIICDTSYDISLFSLQPPLVIWQMGPRLFNRYIMHPYRSRITVSWLIRTVIARCRPAVNWLHYITDTGRNRLSLSMPRE